MATQVEVPSLGESVTQAILIRWHKPDGQRVEAEEPLCELETDKANVDIPAPTAGVLRHAKSEGQTVGIGEVIARIDDGAAAQEPPRRAEEPKGASAPPPPPAPQPPPAPAPSVEDLSPAARRVVREHDLDPSAITGTGRGGRITRQDAAEHLAQRGPQVSDEDESHPHEAAPGPRIDVAPAPPPRPAMGFDGEGVRRVPMSKIRQRIAERLVSAQQTAAILTTFNEIDMSAVLNLRSNYKERFQEVHGVGLGLMSFFVRGCVLALREFPHLNAFIDGSDVVYHQYVHMGIAVSTERGLAVPVLRNVQTMSFGRLETEIKRLATATRDGKLSLEELSGGTFTITNGGVFGSLLSTPIVNPPQSGILGMHAIQKRPVAVGDRVEIRPMMYVALSYDHRLVDGRESVSFLVRLKQFLEDPSRLMLEI